TGAGKIYMQEAFYLQLPILLPLSPTDDTVIGGNGGELLLTGKCPMRFTVVDQPVFHVVSVVRDLPVPFIIGCEIWRWHNSQLSYEPDGRTQVTRFKKTCATCLMYIGDIIEETPEQL